MHRPSSKRSLVFPSTTHSAADSVELDEGQEPERCVPAHALHVAA